MRSIKSNATRFLLKRNLFIGVIVFLLVFSVLPFWGLSHIPNMKESIFENSDLQDRTQMLTNLVSSSVMTDSLNLEMMVIVFGGLGFLSAMMLSRHLFSRRQGMLHAALPDRREADFLRRCVGYAVLCLLPIAVNFLLYLLIVAMNGLLPYVSWSKLLPKFGLLMLINLYGFAMGMLASVLTGTYWAALLAGAVLIVGLEGMAAVWHFLAAQYLHTIVDKGFRELLLRVSPAYSLYKGLYQPESFACLSGIAAILIAMLSSFALYRVRRTEAAEHTLAFDWLHTVMGFVLPLMGGSVLGMIVLMSFTTEISLVAGLVAGTALTYWVCRMVFNQRFCGVAKQWYLPAAAAAVLVMGVWVLHTDAIGYDHFMPEREKLTSVSYRPQGYLTDESITLTSSDALDAAYEWCTLMRNEADGYENGLGAHLDGSSSVLVTYRFGNRTVYRHYPNMTARNEAQSSLQHIIESDDYRQSLLKEYCLDTGNVEDIYLSISVRALKNNELYEQFGVFADYMSLSRREDVLTLNKWVEALKADLLDRTFAEKQQNEIFHLQIHARNPETGRHVYQSMPIYPGDEHFLKAVFGDKAEEAIAYATGGYASNPDLVVLKATYDVSRAELEQGVLPDREIAHHVQWAATPQQAMEWVQNAQTTSAHHYYYMPDREDTQYSRLYLYHMSEVERYQAIYHYTIPADLTKLYDLEEAPVTTVLNCMEE